MARSTSRNDQLARVASELKRGDWWKNARARKQHQQSVWDRLISLLFIPAWLGSAYGLISLAVDIHSRTHPRHVGAPLQGTSAVAVVLMIVPLGIACIFVGGVVANFVVYHIPQARAVLDQEALECPGIDYRSTQRSLLKLGIPSFMLAVVLAVVGAMLR